ncbi:single-pass membrane and coiled-coil domain-containing protein 3-like [Ruditapes philippinarum]|uniref:single-pass membrane and coiled-coil domain-containing protein 3-like n=1 Tax=Ruditapes philippinarum TaxID=129788 RepID=UPI00295C2C66|nr:single-pass membrane and coiled-coil domain-containing protein 3-like [Ruditapes philippinarum]
MGIFEDLFYPDNPKRRAKLEQNIGALYNNLNIDVTATNDLVDIINTHLQGNIKHVSIDNDDTVKANAQRISDCVDAINKTVKQKAEDIKTRLDPKIFKMLMDVSVSFEEKIKIAEEFAESLLPIGGVVGVLSCSIIAGMDFLEGVVEVVGEAATSAFAAIGVGVLFLGIDMIAEAIIGAVERDKLNEEIDKTEKCVEHMQKMTGPYIANVEEIKVRIEMIKPKKN